MKGREIGEEDGRDIAVGFFLASFFPYVLPVATLPSLRAFVLASACLSFV